MGKNQAWQGDWESKGADGGGDEGAQVDGKWAMIFKYVGEEYSRQRKQPL